LKNWYNFHSFFPFFLSLGTAAQKVGRKREKKYPSWSQHIKQELPWTSPAAKNQNQCTEMVVRVKVGGEIVERVSKKLKKVRNSQSC